MPLHYPFTTIQTIWAIGLAAHLTLLVTLLGRDRVARFPWFTAYIALSTARVMALFLLYRKLTKLPYYWVSSSLTLLQAILGVLVLVELVRMIFAGNTTGGLRLKLRGRLGWTSITVIAAGGITVWLGAPWPAWKSLAVDSSMTALLLTQLVAGKLEILVAALAIEVGLLLLVFARRFGFGWRSHPRLIALGLSAYGLGGLILQGIIERIIKTAHPTTEAEYTKALDLLTNLSNSRSALYAVVLIWWIVWLWRDEPGGSESRLGAEGSVSGSAADLADGADAQSAQLEAAATDETSEGGLIGQELSPAKQRGLP